MKDAEESVVAIVKIYPEKAILSHLRDDVLMMSRAVSTNIHGV